MELKEEKHKLEVMLEHLKEYAETRIDLIALEVQDKLSEILSSVATYAVVGLLMFFTLLFISIGAAISLSDYFHSSAAGFFCVAGFYLIVGLIAFLTRRSLIKTPVTNALLKKINFHEEN